MIAIVQYGSGNVQAIANIYNRLGIEVTMASTPQELRAADRIILPGVGAFDRAMLRLNESGMRDELEQSVMSGAKPVLGICVGMQMLASCSEEGTLPGLGWIGGEVRSFDVTQFSDRTHLPHMGWNDVRPCNDSGLFKELEAQAQFYFLHSYYFAPAREQDILAYTDYNGVFASSVASSNVYGVQFHPEKSHHWGVRLLKNFSEL